MSQLKKYVLHERGARLLLPKVNSDDHKGSRGRSLVLAGSKEDPGAGVLAGVITAFRARGLTAFRAALLGAYVHGLTSELWVQQGLDPLSMLASDVIDFLPQALAYLRGG